jgi:hypothetical protein
MAPEQTPPKPALRDTRKRRRELTSLLWLCSWGGVTALALIALAITSRTETAGERLRHIFAGNESIAIARMPPRVAQLESETQILASQVRALSTDRDRLAGRIAMLESTIDDMTGTIKKQAAATAAALAARTTAPTASAPAASPPASNLPTSDTPLTATPVTTIAITAPPKPDTPTLQAPPPPVRTASAATSAATSDPEPPVSKQSDFGLDLGGGATIDAVRQRWMTVKAHFGPLLVGLHPVAARDHRPGATGYRLVVGPLPSSAAASGLCAHFAAARTTCRAVKFDGEQIAQQ